MTLLLVTYRIPSQRHPPFSMGDVIKERSKRKESNQISERVGVRGTHTHTHTHTERERERDRERKRGREQERKRNK